MAIFNGNGNDNTLIGAQTADEINGRGGDDILSGLGGNDILNGGQGKDILKGGTGDDVLNGGDGNDVLKPYEQKSYDSFNRTVSEYDEVTGGGGADLFDLTDATGGVAYFNDDLLSPPPPASPKGFALIKDFNLSQGDKIQLDGFAQHYDLVPVSWGKDYGSRNTGGKIDVAIIYKGANQNQYNDVVAVLQDVSSQFVTNSAGYLNNPNVFQFLG